MTEDQRNKFYNNPSINPITNRSIIIGGSTYNKLVKQFGDPNKHTK